ncbi:hypothetical protein INR49_002034 [Caranx melampygus]|nr:hypothetical protein INR49_002034 [Caranx melampygus]
MSRYSGRYVGMCSYGSCPGSVLCGRPSSPGHHGFPCQQPTSCAIIRPPRDGGIRYRGLTQEQIRSVQILPVDYEIEYICRGNRVIVGPKVRKCLPNGTWTDMTQHSRCLLLCPRVWTSLENGRVTVKPPGPPVEGTVLHYSCHAGFILEGRNISHCTKLGKWDAPKPTCLYADRDWAVNGRFKQQVCTESCISAVHTNYICPRSPQTDDGK